MDDFLTKLFREEQEKVASAELDQFMNQLPRGDLEEILGIAKLAVDGPQIPAMPDSVPPKKLETLQAEKQEYVDREHAGTPKSVDKQPEGALTRVKYTGEGKEAVGKTAEDAAAEKVAWADQAGRLFAKQAMAKTVEFTNPVATLKVNKGKQSGMTEQDSMGAGMETTASVKAKIAARALKVAEGAPEHVKAAAVFLAGREIAKLAR